MTIDNLVEHWKATLIMDVDMNFNLYKREIFQKKFKWGWYRSSEILYLKIRGNK